MYVRFPLEKGYETQNNPVQRLFRSMGSNAGKLVNSLFSVHYSFIYLLEQIIAFCQYYQSTLEIVLLAQFALLMVYSLKLHHALHSQNTYQYKYQYPALMDYRFRILPLLVK